MISYEIHGRIPSAFPADLIPRVARDCSLIKKTYQSKLYQIGVVFLSETEIKKMNRAYRGKSCATDVLSFSSEEGVRIQLPKTLDDPIELGDIFICSSYAAREARRRRIPIGEELIRLLVHGTLHLFGYDHATEKDEERMFAIQEDVVGRLSKKL